MAELRMVSILLIQTSSICLKVKLMLLRKLLRKLDWKRSQFGWVIKIYGFLKPSSCHLQFLLSPDFEQNLKKEFTTLG